MEHSVLIKKAFPELADPELEQVQERLLEYLLLAAAIHARLEANTKSAFDRDGQVR
jgi:hypothetical protein